LKNENHTVEQEVRKNSLRMLKPVGRGGEKTTVDRPATGTQAGRIIAVNIL